MLVRMDVTHPGPGSIEVSSQLEVSGNEERDDYRTLCNDGRTLAEVQGKSASRSLNVYMCSEVVYLRDNLTLLSKKLPQILDSFKRVSPGGGPQGKPYRPTLSIAICDKRHHARFLSDRTEFANHKRNTRPGTVVDQGITSVFDFDFYLQAHGGLQGHVKATHYTVLYDENKFSADDIQQGNNSSCYLYARATKAVSLMPPAYYADLACERGRYYLNDFLNADDKTSNVVHENLRGFYVLYLRYGGRAMLGMSCICTGQVVFLVLSIQLPSLFTN
ncbi:Piwi domain-containing protein [Phlebopus sp. FC_14]|nr:Piwi domain-containing protein [Phlebopus sp. FC_14]